MFDDLDTAEKKTEDEQTSPEDEKESHWWIGPWAHVIAILIFCLLYFPFKDRFWSWQVAITVAYVVFMLCCTCGMSFKDADDFFGNLQVPRYMGGLLARQVLILALVSLGLYLWRYCEPMLPAWVTYEGRRMSLWDYFGIIVVYILAVREASWMTKKIKARFAESEGSD
ncbi:MAG: hypothetical protein ABR860_05805 [Terracidiphilus sp.]|jgi:hypothetical protein